MSAIPPPLPVFRLSSSSAIKEIELLRDRTRTHDGFKHLLDVLNAVGGFFLDFRRLPNRYAEGSASAGVSPGRVTVSQSRTGHLPAVALNLPGETEAHRQHGDGRQRERRRRPVERDDGPAQAGTQRLAGEKGGGEQ